MVQIECFDGRFVHQMSTSTRNLELTIFGTIRPSHASVLRGNIFTCTSETRLGCIRWSEQGLSLHSLKFPRLNITNINDHKKPMKDYSVGY